MSNRTDFDALASEIAEMFDLSFAAETRIENELHNAYVAGLEYLRQVPSGSTGICGCRWCRAERT